VTLSHQGSYRGTLQVCRIYTKLRVLNARCNVRLSAVRETQQRLSNSQKMTVYIVIS